jgi:hypothetical protein
MAVVTYVAITISVGLTTAMLSGLQMVDVEVVSVSPSTLVD